MAVKVLLLVRQQCLIGISSQWCSVLAVVIEVVVVVVVVWPVTCAMHSVTGQPPSPAGSMTGSTSSLTDSPQFVQQVGITLNLVCAGASVCVCVCVCVRACVCVCVCVCMYALRIVSRDKILHFKNLVLLLSTHMLHLFLCRSLLYSTLLSGRLTSLLPRVILNEWPWPFYSAFLNVHCSRVKILVYCLFYLLLCTVRQICL